MRNKLHTVINVMGLALGIGACMVIYLIVSHELNFDRFRPEKDRTYRVITRFSGAFEATNAGVPGPTATTMEEQLVGFEQLAPIYTVNSKAEVELPNGQRKLLKGEGGTVFTDERYFEVIQGEEWLAGTPPDALSAPFQVVLNETNAKLFFGTSQPEEVLDRTLIYADSLPVTVKGIIKDQSRPSDFAFGAYISFNTIERSWLGRDRFSLDSWGGVTSNCQVLVKLEEDFTEERFNEQLKTISAVYAEKNPEASWQIHLTLQPLSDIHFNAEYRPPVGSHVAHRPTLRLLALIAILLLVIAGVNFVNLETAKATERAKEVGVRKVLGGSRSNLTWQFLSETFLITAVAVLVSLAVADWAFLYFAEFIPEGMSTTLLTLPNVLFLLGTLVVVGLLAGLYPAFVLSGFQPAQTLKNQMVASGQTSRKAYLRKSLIVFQFTVAQILIICTFFVGRQINFMLKKDMGFNQEAIIAFDHPFRGSADKRALMKNELERIPGIAIQSLHQSIPAETGYSRSLMKIPGKAEELKLNVNNKYGDTAFINLYNIPLIAGRNLHRSDTVTEFLVNETFVRQIGFKTPEEALSQTVLLNKKPYPIVGVVKDFHVQSLHNPLEPVAIGTNANLSCHSLKLKSTSDGETDFATTIDKVAQVWKKIYPDLPFEYEFVDEFIAGFYENEQRTAKLMKTATFIAILISCLGLFGLASFTAARRVKEIGIRKVLGASIANIVALISRDFVRLVLIGILLASPFAWLAMRKWMTNFAFATGLDWWIFIAAAGVAIMIALLTVSYQSIRAAIANPIDSLRNE